MIFVTVAPGAADHGGDGVGAADPGFLVGGLADRDRDVRVPLESTTWLAALQVVTDRCGGDPGRLAEMGPEAFTALVRDAQRGWGGQKAWGPICRRIFAALTDTEGVVVSCRRGLLRRCADELGDLQRTRAQLRAVEADMVAVLAELGLARLADIPGLTAVGAAAILAETGDPRRYDSSSSLVKHAGLSPAENASGAFAGQAHISRRGRPGLRLAVWRAVWPMLRYNPVMAAKYAAMTGAAAPQPMLPRRLMRDRGRSARPRPQPARAAPRPASRALPPCCAGSTPWPFTAPAGTLRSPPAPPASTPPAARRRQPDQRLHPARTRARVPETFLPEEGESEPAKTSGTNPAGNPGQLSPGRPELLTSSVERCRGKPARIRGQAEPACTT